MLTDEQIRDVAERHVQRVSGGSLPLRPITLTDPDGVFYKVGSQVGDRSTTLMTPFLVRREDGRVFPISAGDVMPGVVTKLWGWAGMRADPELQRAVIDPDFSIPRHVEIWSAIVREVMRGKTTT